MPHILVVDDEAAIRPLVGRVLEKKGFKVTLCGTSAEALARETPYDLLLVDVGLPDLNGRARAERLRERRPQLPVVVMSGYPPQPELTPAPPSAFLQKPMMMTD